MYTLDMLKAVCFVGFLGLISGCGTSALAQCREHALSQLESLPIDPELYTAQDLETIGHTVRAVLACKASADGGV